MKLYTFLFFTFFLGFVFIFPISAQSPVCGDTVIDAGEQCDDGNLNNNDACLNTCQNAQCGDGFVWYLGGGTEQCDLLDLNGYTCLTVPGGFAGGVQLSCTGSCTFDTSLCFVSNGGCGDGIIDPGEACDSRPDDISFGSFGDTLPLGYENCTDFDRFLIGPLGCYGADDTVQLLCQFNVNQCQPKIECLSCDDCGWLLGIGCSQNLCVNFCPDAGSCYYKDDQVVNRCQNCLGVTSCANFTNAQDCTLDVCGIIVREDCTTVPPGRECRQTNELGFTCQWEDDRCFPDERCRWDCSGLFGPCQGDGYRYKVGACSLSGSLNPLDCHDPSVNYPSKISCNLYEKNFPIFTYLNILFSLVLLFGYYMIRRFKNNEDIESIVKKR